MAATTMVPVSTIPTAAGDVGGSFLPAGNSIRLSAILLKQGEDTLYLLRLNDSNYWEMLRNGDGTPFELSVARSGDAQQASGSVVVPVDNGTDKYLVYSKTGFCVSASNATVKMNSLVAASGLASIPSHGGTHISSGIDAIPLAVAGGASGLMSGTQAQQLSELSGSVPGAQTLAPGAPADGTSTALTVNNSVTLVAGNYLLDLANNSGTPVFRVSYLGGVVAPTIGATIGQQHAPPALASSTLMVVGGAQTVTGIKTFSAAPVFGAGVTASGAVSNDFSGGTGTFKTSTGAVTVGGGANAVGITSSAAAITVTGGAASTWSTSAGALTVSGFAGINAQVNGSTVCDVGATSATALTLSANMNLNGAAGTGALTLGSMTGACALPTGNLSWAGANTKTASIVATGAGGTITLTASAASTWKTSGGALTLDGNGGINMQVADATIFDVGVTSATKCTLAANIDLNGAAGTGAVSLGSLTGATTLPTGNISWTGAGTKTLTLAAAGAAAVTSSGGALTLTAAAASTWSTSAGGLTITSAGAATWSSAAGALTITSAAAATWGTAAGALTLNGAGGINAQSGGVTLADFGVTAGTTLTLAANVGLVGAAGTGPVTLGAMTGACTLPTGNLSWAGASTKTLSLQATGAAGNVTVTSASGTVTLTAGAASTWSTTSGGLTITSASAATWSTTAGALSITGGGGLTLTSTGAGSFDGTTSIGLGNTNATSIAIGNNAITTTVTGLLAVGTKLTVTGSSGNVTKYNNVTTAGIGIPYIVAQAQDVASGGMSTNLATYASPATGTYLVLISVSAHTNDDTIVADVTYTDSVNNVASTATIIASVTLTHDSATVGFKSGSFMIRASGATSIVARLSTTAQTTTKASAVILCLNA